MATPQVSFGNPNFWKEIQRTFPKFFEVIPRATASLNDLTSRGYEDVDPYKRAILNFALLTGVSVWELVTLVGNGFGLGAMRVARTVLEIAINAEYLRLMPDEFEDYLEWYWIEQHKLIAFVRDSIPEAFKRLSSDDIDRTERGFAAARARFQRPDGELRRSWCKLDLGARAAKTGFALEFRLINPVSSQLIHGTFGGLTQHFDIKRDLDRISLPPSTNYCAQALIGAHVCLLKVIETLSKALGAEPRYGLSELVRDFKSAWGADPKEAVAKAADE